MRDRKSDRHRTIGARKAGRPLGPSEVVHHVNEDKNDNSPHNLEVASRSGHTAAHNRSRGLSKLRAALRATRDGTKLY